MDTSKLSQFSFDPAIFRLTAVKKAAYRFSGEFDTRIESEPGNRILVTLSPRDDRRGMLSAAAFPREVLDQELREQIANETAAVRDVLLAHTFSELPLIDEVGETADFRKDPHQIDASQNSGAARMET